MTSTLPSYPFLSVLFSSVFEGKKLNSKRDTINQPNPEKRRRKHTKFKSLWGNNYRNMENSVPSKQVLVYVEDLGNLKI